MFVISTLKHVYFTRMYILCITELFTHLAPVSSEDTENRTFVVAVYNSSEKTSIACTFSASNVISMSWFKDGEPFNKLGVPYLTQHEVINGTFHYGLKRAERFELVWQVDDTTLTCGVVETLTGEYTCKAHALVSGTVMQAESRFSVRVFCKCPGY